MRRKNPDAAQINGFTRETFILKKQTIFLEVIKRVFMDYKRKQNVKLFIFRVKYYFLGDCAMKVLMTTFVII